jgi:hypothetical protein
VRRCTCGKRALGVFRRQVVRDPGDDPEVLAHGAPHRRRRAVTRRTARAEEASWAGPGLRVSQGSSDDEQVSRKTAHRGGRDDDHEADSGDASSRSCWITRRHPTRDRRLDHSVSDLHHRPRNTSLRSLVSRPVSDTQVAVSRDQTPSTLREAVVRTLAERWSAQLVHAK